MRRFVMNKSAMKKAQRIAGENGITATKESPTSLLVPLDQAVAFVGALSLERVRFRTENGSTPRVIAQAQ